MRSFLTCAFIFGFLFPAASFAIEEREPGLHGVIGFAFFQDHRIGWTGSEASFYTSAKLDYIHRISEDTIARFGGEFRPTVNDHSRAYDALKKREGSIEDTYMEFDRFLSRNTAIKFGVVKVPFGHFDTFALEERNRPVSMTRTREWDYGIRLDSRFSHIDLSLAVVNGEGTTGTDANSAKSVALMLAGGSGSGEPIYPETLYITNYPNPMVQNSPGGVRWRYAISAYAGNRYTTPIKERNNHYGIDMEFGYSIATLKLQAAHHDGYFNNLSVAEDDLNRLVDEFQYGSAVTLNPENFPKAVSSFAELCIGLSERTLMTIMYEYYDPDTMAAEDLRQVARERVVIGWKRDFRKDSSFAVLYTMNNNPAFARLVEGSPKKAIIVETDDMEGDDVLMMSVAVQF
ncbi:MAG: hypothetical protein OEY64_09860 [Nitrospinota bacterium]|nr:hypothetical protein [Nitrospinota bacterium]